MKKHPRCLFLPSPAIIFLIPLLLVFFVVPAIGQFRIPKIPKLPGQKDETKKQESPKAKATQYPSPELTGISPDNAPPGGVGDLVLTGNNFGTGVSLRFDCSGPEPKLDSFKVENSTRAVVHIAIPFNAKEGACSLALLRKMGRSGPMEISESEPGTTEVVMVPENGPKFRISNSSASMAVGLEVVLLAEGDQDFTSLAMKMSQVMMPGFGKQGEKTVLMLADSIKYMQGKDVVFTEPAGALKAVDDMNMMGQSTGIFRLEFKDGKIYNFIGAGGSAEVSKTASQIIKKRFGK